MVFSGTYFHQSFLAGLVVIENKTFLTATLQSTSKKSRAIFIWMKSVWKGKCEKGIEESGQKSEKSAI